MGCGASNNGQKKDGPASDAKYTPQAEELQGKAKYIAEVGACVMQVDAAATKSKFNGTFVVYITPDGATAFAFLDAKSQLVYKSVLTDAEFTEVKTAQNITWGWPAVFKSLSVEVGKGRAKVVIGDTGSKVEFSITSVKDPKVQQVLTIPLTQDNARNAIATHIVLPMMNMVQKKRQGGEERDKETKMGKLEAQSIALEASITLHRATQERIQPHIVPLREEAASYSKASAELSSNIARIERRLRKLHSDREKNFHDGLFDEGGARHFQHLQQSEDHVPVERSYDGDVLNEWLRSVFPMKAGEDLKTVLTRPPTDPAVVQMLEKAPNKQGAEDAMKVFQRLDDWDMSVFELEKATDNTALFHVTYAMLYKLDLVREFNIDDKILRNFLGAMQAGYHPNPYHNATHAADVAQINYFIVVKGGLVEKCKLNRAELLGAIMAGAIHDFDHPGFNNNFHTRTNAYLSTLYNDKSILENHHLASIFEMVRKPKYNVFASLTDEQRRDVRDTMIEMVLATDMGLHGKYFSSFRRRLSEGSEWSEQKDDVRLALAMSIKMADISNCGRPKHLYLEWAKCIAREFYNQGDEEAKLCLTISPFMDRRKDKTDFPKGQISFMNFIVVPMFEAISEFLPPVECALRFCTENKEYWQTLE